jgi:hypothetical protein
MSGLELIGLLGTAISGVGTIAAGAAQKNAADFEAQQMEMKAKEETAAAQRDALAKKRKAQSSIPAPRLLPPPPVVARAPMRRPSSS